MRLSARVDYALRASAELAVAGSHPVTAVQLAEAQQIPPKFLENILGQLRRSGLVRASGGEGGYWLARPPSGSPSPTSSAPSTGRCSASGERPEHVGYEGPARSLQEVWIALRASERSILEQVTLAHIAAGELPRPSPS